MKKETTRSQVILIANSKNKLKNNQCINQKRKKTSQKIQKNNHINQNQMKAEMKEELKGREELIDHKMMESQDELHVYM